MTTKRVKLIGKKKFTTIALDPEKETFVVHIMSISIAFFSFILLDAFFSPFHRSKIVILIANEAFIKVFAKYAKFIDVFFPNLAFKLPKHIGINNDTIKLVNSQQPPYGLIYSLEPIELEILKAYIETNLANRFIRLFK